MQENLKRALSQVRLSPDGSLGLLVLQKIQKREKQSSYVKILILGLVCSASMIALVPALSTLGSDLRESGFYEYISLAFSSGALFTYWREIALSILESLPAGGIALSLTLIFVFFVSVKYGTRQIVRNHTLLTY